MDAEFPGNNLGGSETRPELAGAVLLGYAAAANCSPVGAWAIR